MSAEKTELREILEKNIGDVYKNALAALDDQAAAKEVTRRVMELLKRTYEAGLSVTPSTVKRLTEDCCKEQASYNSKKTAFRHGVIADMPDFDTAIASITGEEVRAKARSDAEDKAAEAHRAIRQAEALEGRAITAAGPWERPEPRRRYACAADIFDDTAVEPMAAQGPKEDQVDAVREARARVEKVWAEFDLDDDDDDDDDEYDYDMDDDEYDDDDDDDDDDDEYESLFEENEKTPMLPLIGILTLIALLACVAFCLIVMLMQRNVLPGGSSGFVKNFAVWFNSHLFPLF